jgi:hypothetical protein
VAHTGVTTKELMRRGGHASPSAALRHQHLAEGRDREIADALGTMFDGPSPKPGRVVPIRPVRGTPRDHRAMEPARSSTGRRRSTRAVVRGAIDVDVAVEALRDARGLLDELIGATAAPTSSKDTGGG